MWRAFAIIVFASAAVTPVFAAPNARTPGDRSDDSAAREFFEKEVRPILVKRCGSCHGAEKTKGGLRLDSKAGLRAGGLGGLVVDPEKPAESRLLDAVGYEDETLQMPPKSKLPNSEIATLRRWVESGAFWPEEPGAEVANAASSFDLEARAKHWSFQTLATASPPVCDDPKWPLNPIDRFILSKLDSAGIAPAPPANRRALIRRLYFDLIGLPPGPDEVESFANDASNDAYEKLVDRLLASPHYGERWARHWLDLVRFAETSGHEFDYDIPNAYRYRDYVIRALNADVRFDQFVTEHLAGDLLTNPRRHPTEHFNESVIGTGFFMLGEGTHSPVDLREEAARRVDNQIDVLGKAFLGMTVACARCHDHKFDPIRQADYYALAGYLRSSRHQHAFLDDPRHAADQLAEIGRLKAEAKAFVARQGEALGRQAVSYLSAALAFGNPAASAAIVREHSLDEKRLRLWLEALQSPSAKEPGHPLFVPAAIWKIPRKDWRGEVAAVEKRLATTAAREVFETFDNAKFEGWSVNGAAFGDGPARSREWRTTAAGPLPVARGVAHSGLMSDKFQGVLRSRTFTIDSEFIQIRASGRAGRIQVVVDGFEKIRSPIYGGLSIKVDGPWRWHSIDVRMWRGHDAYVEIADGAIVDFSGSTSGYVPGDGWIAVDEIRYSNEERPTGQSDDWSVELLRRVGRSGVDRLAAEFGSLLARTWDEWSNGQAVDASRVEALARCLELGLVTTDSFPAEWAERLARVEQAIAPPTLAPALLDGTGLDAPLLVRGDPRTPGKRVPRRYLEVLAGARQDSPGEGSGRLVLAERMVNPAMTPQVPRVLVNRLWEHHFGAGIVSSADDFGHMGDQPTHPELLDWLASEFVRRGWSIKEMQRLMVTSRTYRMSSAIEPGAEQRDPNNRLLHRMPLHRLEAEALRDAMLAVSTRLDRTLFGPSVPVHLTEFQEGRGRPGNSGPLDGNGRRSIYLNIRRNFLPPLLTAFDFPTPTTTIGRRNESNVPAQSLALLNDPFVLEQARTWARAVLTCEPADAAHRIDLMYRSALARPPSEPELNQATRFFRGHESDEAAWSDFALVLFELKEFRFIP